MEQHFNQGLIRRRRRQRRRAGMTLVEIMIVVIIMALIATAVGVAVLPRMRTAQDESTRTDAQAIRSAVTMFLAENPGSGCPTVEDLEGAYLDASKRTVDAWENPFEIECEGDQIYVLSAGSDGQFGTEDDIE